MKLTLSPAFPLGSTVYPKLDPTPENACMVTGILVRPGGHLVYLVSDFNGDEKEREECELTNDVEYRTGAGDGE